MKILKIYPTHDNPGRINYQVNYGVWDAIKGDKVILEKFNTNLNNYDVVFLPMYKRWKNHMTIFNRIKDSKIKTVLFDNDSCYRTFGDRFYDGIDFIFYRDLDKNKKEPNTNSMWLPWSINTDLYKAKFGGSGIIFNCTVNNHYPLRQKVSKIIKNKNSKNGQYISSLQNSGAAIHTDSDLVPMVRAKALEIASCGTQIISNRTQKMDYFYPDDLILYFNDIKELPEIIKNFKPNIEIQKELRRITEEKHDDKIRAQEVLNKIKEII